MLLFHQSLLGRPTVLLKSDSLLLQRQQLKSMDDRDSTVPMRPRFGKQLFRGTCMVFGLNTLASALLIALTENTSKWNKTDAPLVLKQYRNTFTKPPVIDGDLWYINYLGHPYQGACYYNALRCQGATWWQSGLFSIVHSTLWEYVAEGGMEQPSMQDLIVTPIAGSLLGELIHFSTLRMGRNGFTWYEKAFVCVFNPMYVLKNGLRKKAMLYHL